MTTEKIIFLICSLIIIGSALMVVSVRKLIHAALWLVATLFGVAILFVVLQAGFLAMVQVVVYIGAIAILFIFAVMLTRRELLDNDAQTQATWWIPFLLSILILTGLVFIIIKQPDFSRLAPQIPANVDTLRNLGISLVSMDAFMLPFEVASLLLLAALVGAVYIATERKTRR
jgi:NADH-quinone oxidoreductase subunit J